MAKIGSYRYDKAVQDPDVLQTQDAADHLGVAVGWLRKHVPITEWHHCYLVKYGGSAVAHFWHKDDLDSFANEHSEETAAARRRKQRAKALKEQVDGQANEVPKTVLEVGPKSG